MVKVNIKDILKQKGKTKYWLVKETELNYQSISDIMNNQTTAIRFDTMEKLCNVLDCTPNDLFTITTDKNN